MYLSTIPMDRGTKYDTFVTTNTYDKYEPMTTTLLQATDLGGGNNIQNLAGSGFLTPPPPGSTISLTWDNGVTAHHKTIF